MAASILSPYLAMSLASLAAATVVGTTQTLVGIDISSNYTYLLPSPFNYTVSGNFIDTATPSTLVNQLFAQARKAYYYAYDPEFHEILGDSPTIQLVASAGNGSVFASEGGAWVPERNEVWFTSSQSASRQQYYSILHLANNTISSPDATSPINIQSGYNLGGADYHDGIVYLANLGNRSASIPPSILAVDPTTQETELLLNSYYGLPFNDIDDISWTPPASSNSSRSSSSSSAAAATQAACQGEYMFFTTIDLAAAGETYFSKAELPNAIFRFDPQERAVRAVISRGDVLAPNGIRTSMDGTRLYVTDVAYTGLSGVGSSSSGSSAIYVYDLDNACLPVNKRLFALVRSGIADGIHVDAYGRVWTAEGNGVVVRRAIDGKELGVFNAEVLDNSVNAIANFALAGDKLVVLADSRIWVVQLGQMLSAAIPGLP